jgi:peptide subunit release factor RF-3
MRHATDVTMGEELARKAAPHMRGRARGRAFAIVSYADAGRTILTEKLLFGGAIQLAGKRRRVRSDWMAVERERGISVSSARHQGLAFQLLDARLPRTLTAVDSAVMVLDAEEQTCTLRFGFAHHDRLPDETSPSRECD